MDKHDFDVSGLQNQEFVNAMRQNFGQQPKSPAPHYIDTTQQPEDKPDFGLWSSLGGLATNYGLAGLAFTCLLFVLYNR